MLRQSSSPGLAGSGCVNSTGRSREGVWEVPRPPYSGRKKKKQQKEDNPAGQAEQNCHPPAP